MTKGAPMSVATAMDVRDWIYGLTKNEQIGKKTKAGQNAYAKTNGNFSRVLSDPVLLSINSQPTELPAGSELVVYRKLHQRADGKWATSTDYALAAIFVKKDGRTVEQISVRMSGRTIRRAL